MKEGKEKRERQVENGMFFWKPYVCGLCSAQPAGGEAPSFPTASPCCSPTHLISLPVPEGDSRLPARLPRDTLMPRCPWGLRHCCFAPGLPKSLNKTQGEIASKLCPALSNALKDPANF